jgi:hypothetical protein
MVFRLSAAGVSSKKNGGQVWAACRLGETRDSSLWFRLKGIVQARTRSEFKKISLEEKMNRLHEQVGTQLRTFGRCAMMGTLIGLMTTQAFAASAPAVPSEPAAAPETTSMTTSDSTQAIAAMPVANLQVTADSVVPEAPAAPEEQASVTKPIDIRAIMDDAAQSTQNLQSTTTQQKPHQIHPGWLALTGVGALLFAIGIVPLASSTTRGKPIAAGFVGVGAGLAGLGLYLTFK